MTKDLKTTNETQSSGDMVPNIAYPLVSPEQAKEAWERYEALKEAIVKHSDIQMIGQNRYLKKSYWRKIGTFYNVTVEVVEERTEELPHDNLAYHFTVKAIAPNGRTAVGTGSCDLYEKASFKNGQWMKEDKNKVTEWGHTKSGKSYPVSFEWVEAYPNSYHNVRTMAETRAFNRAVSNLVGGGENSAEEILEENENGSPKTSELTKQTVTNSKTKVNEGGACPECHAPAGKIHATGCSKKIIDDPSVTIN